MQEDVKLVDLLIELVDARVPAASRNPDIESLGAGKGRLLILNKADLADEAASAAWERYFTSKGYAVVKADSRNGAQLKKVNAAVQAVCSEKIERDRRRGIVGRPVSAMVVGIPNVGKSTFINSFAGKASAKTGNKPGVTRGNQWIRLSKTLELLDTPGLLWPKFEDAEVGLHLAMTGAINDQILNIEELAFQLIRLLERQNPGTLAKRYGVGEDGAISLEEIAVRRGCLVRGGGADTAKAAGLLLDDFRSGRLGRITLELPPETAQG